MDQEGRIVDRSVALKIVNSVKGSDGKVSDYRCETKKQPAPIPFSLADLTMLASKLHGMTAENVLRTAQTLYEKHKVASYPRTDTGFLPESQHADAPMILASIAANRPDLSNLVAEADPTIKSRAFADSKVTAHHGIIPTAQRVSMSALSKDEALVNDLIVKRYIAQFYPHYEYLDTRVETTIAAEVFLSTGKTVLSMGWRQVLPGGATKEQVLPKVEKEDHVSCHSASVKNAKTVPPKHYTEGTLIYAMENIHRVYAGSADDKASLKEGDGIGTSATRASIISELKRREYLVPNGKSIISTPYGRSVIDAYPEDVKSAHLTAMNERKLKRIERTGEGLESFMQEQESYIRHHTSTVSSLTITAIEPPKPKKPANRNGKTVPRKKASGATSEHCCKQCGSSLVLRVAKEKKKKFWGCSNFPDCKSTYQDRSGNPVL